MVDHDLELARQETETHTTSRYLDLPLPWQLYASANSDKKTVYDGHYEKQTNSTCQPPGRNANAGKLPHR